MSFYIKIRRLADTGVKDNILYYSVWEFSLTGEKVITIFYLSKMHF